jgi:hypothetical protein
MQRIEPNETELAGNWIFEDGRVSRDSVSERIKWLTQIWLTKISDSRLSGGWETLYQDPSDGRLWERTYPKGEMHGGGPPRLALLTPDEAAMKYDGVPSQKS